MDNNELEVLLGQNVLSALADIVFEGAKKVEIPFKLKNGTKIQNHS